MSVIFIFNNGESKRIDKPLANLLVSKGMGSIEGEAKDDAPPLNKASKQVKHRSKK
jgi:hypothetical protein